MSTHGVLLLLKFNYNMVIRISGSCNESVLLNRFFLVELNTADVVNVGEDGTS